MSKNWAMKRSEQLIRDAYEYLKIQKAPISGADLAAVLKAHKQMFHGGRIVDMNEILVRDNAPHRFVVTKGTYHDRASKWSLREVKART